MKTMLARIKTLLSLLLSVCDIIACVAIAAVFAGQGEINFRGYSFSKTVADLAIILVIRALLHGAVNGYMYYLETTYFVVSICMIFIECATLVLTIEKWVEWKGSSLSHEYLVTMIIAIVFPTLHLVDGLASFICLREKKVVPSERLPLLASKPVSSSMQRREGDDEIHSVTNDAYEGETLLLSNDRHRQQQQQKQKQLTQSRKEKMERSTKHPDANDLAEGDVNDSVESMKKCQDNQVIEDDYIDGLVVEESEYAEASDKAVSRSQSLGVIEVQNNSESSSFQLNEVSKEKLEYAKQAEELYDNYETATGYQSTSIDDISKNNGSSSLNSANNKNVVIIMRQPSERTKVALARNSVIMQGKPQIPKQHPNETEEDKVYRKRMLIVDEIISTEESFVTTLRMLNDVFIQPLKYITVEDKRASTISASSIDLTDPSATSTEGGETEKSALLVSEKQLRSIFLEVETLMQVNGLLLKDLHSRFKDWSRDKKIGDVFLKILPFLKHFKTYANNFETALKTVAECRNVPSFQGFLFECRNNPRCNKMWLEDHLITPIQRVPRYRLLLQDLVSKTPASHPDYDDLVKALDAVKILATEINTTKANSENSLALIDVQRKVKYCPKIVEPSRHLLTEVEGMEMLLVAIPDAASDGSLKFKGLHQAFGERRPVVIYLFNDMVLMAQHQKLDSFFGRFKNTTKTYFQGKQYNQPITIEEGRMVIHKYKFISSASLLDVVARRYEDDPPLLNSEGDDCGFTIYFPMQDDEVHFLTQSHQERNQFVDTFEKAKRCIEEETSALPSKRFEGKSWKPKATENMKMTRRYKKGRGHASAFIEEPGDAAKKMTLRSKHHQETKRVLLLQGVEEDNNESVLDDEENKNGEMTIDDDNGNYVNSDDGNCRTDNDNDQVGFDNAHAEDGTEENSNVVGVDDPTLTTSVVFRTKEPHEGDSTVEMFTSIEEGIEENSSLDTPFIDIGDSTLTTTVESPKETSLEGDLPEEMLPSTGEGIEDHTTQAQAQVLHSEDKEMIDANANVRGDADDNANSTSRDPQVDVLKKHKKKKKKKRK
eukprot:m.10620 g.10620  ORF g.10620 m.10620 type:complete len:1058 (+) comp3694_c0_seq2:193-3366(+)